MLGFILTDKTIVPTPSSAYRRTVYLDAGDGTLKMMDSNRVSYAISGLGSMIIKSATQTRTSTTTYADDSELLFAVGQNKDYLFSGKIFFETGATPDFKIQVTVPSSPNLFLMQQHAIAPGATSYSNIAIQTATTSTVIAGGAGNGVFEFSGILRNGSNSGNLAVQWAQNVSDAGNTKVLVGSILEFRQISGYGLTSP